MQKYSTNLLLFLSFRTVTPNSAILGIRTPSMEHAIELKYSLRKAKTSLLWGLINVIMLAVIIYDL